MNIVTKMLHLPGIRHMHLAVSDLALILVLAYSFVSDTD